MSKSFNAGIAGIMSLCVVLLQGCGGGGDGKENAAPVAQSANLAATEDTPLDIVLDGDDADEDTLSFAIKTAPEHGTLSGTVPNLRYVPQADYSGADSLTFTVRDGEIESAPGTVTITVAAVNDAPVAQTAAHKIETRAAVAITLQALDVESDALAYEIVQAPTRGSLSGTPPNLSYTATSSGPDLFTFKARDAAESNIAAINLTNELPVVGRALLGPLGGASVRLYDVADLDTPLVSTTTSSGDALDEIGYFELPFSATTGAGAYLIDVRGGHDFDADDNGQLDATSTVNKGALRAVVGADDFAKGFVNVTILSEIAYARLGYLLAGKYPAASVLDELDQRSRLILRADVDGNGLVGRSDITAWTPLEGGSKAQASPAELQSLSARLRAGTLQVTELLMQSDPVLPQAILGENANPAHYFERSGFLLAVGRPVLDVSGESAGGELDVIDLSEPDRPTVAAQKSFDGAVSATLVEGRLIYLTRSPPTYLVTLGVLNVTDPLHPADLGAKLETDLFLPARGSMVYRAPYLYVADGAFKLSVYQADDALTEVGHGAADFGLSEYSSSGGPLVIRGDLAYSGNGAEPRISIWNISSPNAPAGVALIDVPLEYGIEDMVLVGDRLFAVDFFGTLVELSLADPLSPAVLGTYAAAGAAIQIFEGKLLIGDSIVDVTVPGEASISSVRNTEGALEVDFIDRYRVGNYSYLFAKGRVAAISETAAPLVGRYISEAVTDDTVTALTSVGTRIYASTTSEIIAFDLDVQGALLRKGSVALGGFPAPSRLVHSGGRLYGMNLSSGQLGVWNVGGASPVRISSLELSENVYDFAADGSVAAVVTRHPARVIAIDISTATPRQAGLWELEFSAANSLEVHGGFAYFTDSIHSYSSNSGIRNRDDLRIFNISNPDVPSELSSTEIYPDTEGSAFLVGLSVSGDLALTTALSGPEEGVYIMDVSDRSQPQTLGYYASFHRPYDVLAIQGRKTAYTLGYALSTIDVSDPAIPRFGHYVEFPHFISANRTSASGDWLVVAKPGGLASIPQLPDTLPAVLGFRQVGASVAKRVSEVMPRFNRELLDGSSRTDDSAGQAVCKAHIAKSKGSLFIRSCRSDERAYDPRHVRGQ